MWKRIKEFFVKPKVVYKEQLYPLFCESNEGVVQYCKDCSFCSIKQCTSPYTYEKVSTRTIADFVAYDIAYEGVRSYKQFVKKHEEVEKLKEAKLKKYESTKRMLQAGACYLAAMELCKELGLDIKQI